MQIWCSSSIWLNYIIIHQSNNYRKSGHFGYWPKLHCLFFFVTSQWFIQHGIHHLGIWDVQKNKGKKHPISIRWELTTSKWSYLSPYKWPQKDGFHWVFSPLKKPRSGVMGSSYTLLTTGDGVPSRPNLWQPSTGPCCKWLKSCLKRPEFSKWLVKTRIIELSIFLVINTMQMYGSLEGFLINCAVGNVMTL